jgi:outer membrane immunogenic protein
LLYVKGGFAYANFRLGVTDSVPPLTTDATERLTYTGWTIGGGVEFALTQNWLIKTEYQFMDLAESRFLLLPAMALPTLGSMIHPPT